MNIHHFINKKQSRKKIHFLTCYDYWTAQILNESEIDGILVGDSCAMVMHGHESTLTATLNMMCLHTQAVAKGAKNKFIVADMPFGTYRKSVTEGIDAAIQLMQAGAHAVKLEGVRGHEDLVSHLVESGIPVMGHLGLTPQSVHGLGGYKVQGKSKTAADLIYDDALLLEKLGCFSIVFECIPTSLAQRISKELKIPSIGIGAGPDTDGQILVLQDMLGGQKNIAPKFLRRFEKLDESILSAVNIYCQATDLGSFPSIKESYE